MRRHSFVLAALDGFAVIWFLNLFGYIQAKLRWDGREAL